MSDGGISETGSFKARVLSFLMHKAFLVTRGLTLGVRAACFDAEGRIFLVRHSYLPGWHMPGGGVERGESVPEALKKELREEGNLDIRGAPQLIQIYHQRSASRHAHVLFYRVDVIQTAPRLPNWEIVESGFFALDALPEGVTGATLRRLKELDGGQRAEYW